MSWLPKEWVISSGSGGGGNYAPLTHTHAIADVSALQGALDAKLATVSFTWANLGGKPTTFTPAAHTHVISEVTGLQAALDGKQVAGSYLTSLLSTGSAVGYATGAGGAVTQLTSRTTGVTLSKTTGTITLFSKTTTASLVESFTVTNTTVAATDTINLSIRGTGVYLATVTNVAAGSFRISVFTPAAVSPAEAPVINFAVVKGVSS